MLPDIRGSSEVYGRAASESLLREVPVAGILGDQQAATFGQTAFETGESTNTYGTGNFLIVNTGEEIVKSKNGLLTTVAYRLGNPLPGMPSRARSRSPDRWCSGRATTSASSGGRPRSRLSRPPFPTTAVRTSSRPFPGSLRPTGGRMRAARSSA